MTVTRGTSLSGLPGLLAEWDVDATGVLREFGVDPASIGQYERVLTYQQVASVIGTAAELSGHPDLAMRLAQRQGVEILGPLAVVIRHSATFADAMDATGRFLYSIAPADVIVLRREQSEAVLHYDMTVTDLRFREHVIEKAMVTALSACRVILGEAFTPASVTFRHQPMSDAEIYRDIFRAPVEFGSDDYALHLPRHVIDHPVGGHDSAALRLAEDFLARTTPSASLSDSVGEVIRRLLGLDRASIVAVAKALGLHQRVLQRRLADEGATFEKILDGVRRSLAWDLAASDLSATQISHQLGYSEQSSYARSCRRWFGESPRQLSAHRRSEVTSI